MANKPGYGVVIKLLLVENSSTVVAMIQDSLAPLGSSVDLSVAVSLAEARIWLDSSTPDMVISGLLLPDGKGTDLLYLDRDNAPFPVILLTGGSNEMEAVEAMKSGAFDYLLKTPEVLANMPRVIARCLREWDHILRQRMTEESLKASEERFRSIFNTAAAGMVIISAFGRIMQVNPAFCRFTGFAPEELLNRGINELSHPDEQDKIAAMYHDLFTLRTSAIDCERRYLCKDGSFVWGQTSVACVLESNNSPAYCIALVQDITLQKMAQEKILQANRELDAFVHTVSHDLRSPLTPILGYVQYLQEHYQSQLDEQACDMLAEVMQQGERMLSMLEDLLTLATVGALERPDLPICSNDALQEVLQGRALELATSGAVVVSGDIPAMRIPKSLYLQIVDNLLGNALQYAGKGVIAVNGERRGDVVRLSVSDQGQGIAAEDKKRIFELFYRGSTGKGKSGTGIGLATVQKIARLYGGKAWVEDAPGGGSIFMVEFIG